MTQDQQPIPAHSNGHYYYVKNIYSFVVDGCRAPFKFLHLSNAIQFAKNKTIPCIVYNQDNIVMFNFSKIHEF